MDEQLIPASRCRAEIRVSNSRFIATLSPAFSVEAARAFIAEIRAEFHDATHNVPAFIIGHGASVITHSSDDGEPAGTAGRPALTVLQGSGLGDVAVVVTRYFGGTKLGTGGLVRAYSEAVRAVLAITPRARKTVAQTVELVCPYPLYERVLRLAAQHNGVIERQQFTDQVRLVCVFPQADLSAFQQTLGELTHGQIQATVIATNPNAILPIS